MTGIDTREMSHDEWLEARREGIGGSDAPVIMGASPWRSALNLYLEKIGEAKPFEGNEATWIGTQLEEPVARRFEEETGKKVARANKIILNPDYPWMIGNIDRRVVGERAGLEVKTTSPYNDTKFEDGVLPPVYFWQGLHYLVLTGYDSWYFAILHLYKGFSIFKIDAADYQDEMRALIEAEREFWQEHVVKKNPPLPRGTDSDDEAISDMYPAADEGITIDLEWMDDVLNLVKLKKAQIEYITKEVSELEQQVKMAMGSAERGTTKHWKVSWANSTRNTIDTKALKNDLPDVAARYTKQSTSRIFRVSPMKSDEK